MRLSDGRGFSLSEVLVVTAIVSVLFALGLTAYARLLSPLKVYAEITGTGPHVDRHGDRRVTLIVLSGNYERPRLRYGRADDEVLKRHRIYPYGPHGKRLYVYLERQTAQIALHGRFNEEPVVRIKDMVEK